MHEAALRVLGNTVAFRLPEWIPGSRARCVPPCPQDKNINMRDWACIFNAYVLISPERRQCNAGVHVWVVELKQQTAALSPSSRAQHSPLFPRFTEAPRKCLCSLACCSKAKDANLHLTPVSDETTIYVRTPVVLNY